MTTVQPYTSNEFLSFPIKIKPIQQNHLQALTPMKVEDYNNLLKIDSSRTALNDPNTARHFYQEIQNDPCLRAYFYSGNSQKPLPLYNEYVSICKKLQEGGKRRKTRRRTNSKHKKSRNNRRKSNRRRRYGR